MAQGDVVRSCRLQSSTFGAWKQKLCLISQNWVVHRAADAITYAISMGWLLIPSKENNFSVCSLSGGESGVMMSTFWIKSQPWETIEIADHSPSCWIWLDWYAWYAAFSLVAWSMKHSLLVVICTDIVEISGQQWWWKCLPDLMSKLSSRRPQNFTTGRFLVGKKRPFQQDISIGSTIDHQSPTKATLAAIHSTAITNPQVLFGSQHSPFTPTFRKKLLKHTKNYHFTCSICWWTRLLNRNRGVFSNVYQTSNPKMVKKLQAPTPTCHHRSRLYYLLLQLALFFPTTVAGDNWLNLGVLLGVFALLVVLADKKKPADISHQYSKRFGEGRFSTHQTPDKFTALPNLKDAGKHCTVPKHSRIVSTGEIFRIFYWWFGWRSQT